MLLYPLGVPLDGAALLRSAVKLKSSSPIRPFVQKTSKYDADLDGVPSKSFHTYRLVTK